MIALITSDCGANQDEEGEVQAAEELCREVAGQPTWRPSPP